MLFTYLKLRVLARNIALILIVLGLVALCGGFFYGVSAVDFVPPQDPSPGMARAHAARVAATTQVQQEWFRAGRLLLGLGLGIGVLQTVARVLGGARRKA